MSERPHDHTSEPQHDFRAAIRAGTTAPARRPQAATPESWRALARELEGTIAGEVRFDEGSRALYATDASNYRQVPIGVVVPRSIEDIVATVAACRRHGAPVLARGGGTSLAGQCCNVAVVIDTSKYLNRVLEIDPERRIARVEPGCVLDTLRNAARTHGLTFGPDPATHTHCTLGGMIGNNSCGVHSVMAGRTADNVESLDVLLYDGTRLRVGRTSEEELTAIVAAGGRHAEIYRRLRALRDRHGEAVRRDFPDIPRRVSGYNLDELLAERGFHVARALVGSECTCALVLEATVELVPNPAHRALVVLGYPDVFAAADDVPDLMQHRPIGLEGMDSNLVEYMRRKGLNRRKLELLPEGSGFLLVELGADSEQEVEDKARALGAALERRETPPSIRVFTDIEEQESVWLIRESGLGATARVPGMADTWPGWEDSAVPPESVGDYLRELRALLDRYGYSAALYGHFGQGCIHCRISFDLTTAEGIRTWRRFLGEAAALVVRYGGSLSGEHGDGQARGELLAQMYSPAVMDAFREFKQIWDPDWKMNPGKVIDPDAVTANLRFGAAYRPEQPPTHFRFPNDRGSLAHATTRCVGVGKCRRESGGTMCPSYMVTREEMHSTRGRAHLLFEMLGGHLREEGFRSEHVKEALDLCLACKGCKSDCPVNVDVATYKAEFMAHYYAGRLRPPAAYLMGHIDVWARLAAHLPGVANFFAHTEPFAWIGKRLGGIAPERDLPRFAPQTFVEWTRRRGQPANGSTPRPEVILWADTFNNHFNPETAVAALEVLEAAGFAVRVPTEKLCCGRPLYDFGFLDRAKQQLLRILTVLREPIRRGVPIVVLEPSCLAVFRDEMPELLPNDEDAARLHRQARSLAEMLADADWTPPRLEREALVHQHCHHKAVLGTGADNALLAAIGLEATIPESGCCGMAGSFGFEREKLEVSIACGERVLLPAVRLAPRDRLIVADGFSCREQIAHGSRRRSLHLAQVLKMAMREGPTGPRPCPPEGASYLEFIPLRAR